jgi:hypothetical protein
MIVLYASAEIPWRKNAALLFIQLSVSEKICVQNSSQDLSRTKARVSISAVDLITLLMHSMR